MNGLPRLLYEDIVRAAIREDLGAAGDLTTDAIVTPEHRSPGTLVARAAGRLSGVEPAILAFALLDPGIAVSGCLSDGQDVETGMVIARLDGSTRALLTAERTALNLLGHLSGVATVTRGIVRAVANWPARIVCTRKTTPGLRALEKAAVRHGGGSNHRFGLDDAVLIKDNHLAVAGSVREAVERVRRSVGHMVKVELEVDTLDQLEEALAIGVDAVLLDNMDVETLSAAVRMARGRALTEASGGITPATAPQVAATGVDMISIGWLTHSAPSLDVALDVG
jgi:nicotinate-nucleotide pyrophosphorylase (carboxylating)